MKQFRKKERIVQAYCLGETHPKLDELIGKGYIRQIDEAHWRVFSREASDGEIACSGDYIKVDSAGRPYPNDRMYFRMNHRHLGGDDYRQISRPLYVWDREEDMCKEVLFAIEHKGLVIDENSENACFRAPLWGDLQTAAEDAVIIFDEVKKALDQTIEDVSFHFVARDEFDRNYEEISESEAGDEVH